MRPRVIVSRLLSLSVLLTTGCAGLRTPTGDLEYLPVSTVSSPRLHIQSARLREQDGRLSVLGRVFPSAGRRRLGGTQVEVTCFDASGRIVSEKRTPIRFAHPRIGPVPSASFWLTMEPWPASTTEIVVRADPWMFRGP